MAVGHRLIQDGRFAARLLRREPGFTLTALLSLTLGIAAGTIVFTFVKALLAPALPVKDPSRLVLVYSTTRSRTGQLSEYQSTSYPNARDYQTRNTVFSGLAIIVDSACTVERGDRSTRVGLNLTTADYFEVLGVAPERGRVISRRDDEAASPPVVVVSHAVWVSQLGGDDRAIGTRLRLNGHEYTIVGVMPREFAHIGELPAADVWIPAVWHDQVLRGNIHDWYNVRVARVASMVGRLKPDVSLREADAAMTALGSQLERDYPNDNAGRNVMLVPLTHTVVPPSQRALYVRAGAVASTIVAIVLLIACSNVAHLLLARASHRRQEFSIRVALGASRGDIIAQLLTEGALLAAAACLLGSVAAYWATRVATESVPATLRAHLDLTFDARVTVFAMIVSAAATVVFALGPAWRASRRLETASLDANKARVGEGTSSVHGLLVVGEIGLAVVALVTAGLFIRSLWAAARTDLGFDLDRQVVASVNLAALEYPAARVQAFDDAVMRRLQTLPGIASVTISDTPPLSGSYRRTAFPADADVGDPSTGRLTGVVAVEPRFFGTVGMRLLKGRDFEDRDAAGRPLVAVVNEAAAKTLWPDDDPVGKRLRFLLQDWDVTVVGLVNTVTYASVNEPPAPVVYMPLAQHPSAQTTVYVRAVGDPAAETKTIRNALASIEPALASTSIRTGQQVLDQLMIDRRLGARLLGTVGLVALLLAVLGTFGVVSYTVGRTRREIGIRIALGSTRGAIFQRALARSLVSVAAGIALGLLLQTVVVRLTASMLYGIGLFDPVSVGVAVGVLLATALGACVAAIWRATNVDPSIVLRSE